MKSTVEISLNGRLSEINEFIFMMEILQTRELEKDNFGNSLFKNFFNNKKGDSSRELSYSDTINILKSNVYLMLYNVIEYTVSNLIELIYEDIKMNNLSYRDVSESIRKIFINSFIKKPLNDPNASFKTILKKIEELASFMINCDVLNLNRKDSFPAGNLDGKNIKKIMDSHGIKLNFRDQVCNIFDNLKQKRNDLAHGSISFVDALNGKTVEDIKSDVDEITNVLHSMVNLVEDYIKNGNYRGANR